MVKSRYLPWIADEYSHFFSLWTKDRDSSSLVGTSHLSHATFASVAEPEKHEAYQKERKNWKDMEATESVAKYSVLKSANIIESHALCTRKSNSSVNERI